MEIVFDSNGVFVLFTLLEKPQSYGPVNIPKDDLPLEGLNNLNNLFN